MNLHDKEKGIKGNAFHAAISFQYMYALKVFSDWHL